jgi:MFS family permease
MTHAGREVPQVPAGPDAEARRLLPLILGITGMGVLTFNLIAPALPDLADALGFSRATIGLVQGAVAVPGVVLAIFIGYLADLKGRRFIAVASLLVFGAAGTAAYATRSFWTLVGMRAVQGIGVSGILSLGVILIGDLFPPGRQRRWALGVNSAGLTMTGMVAPIIGGSLAGIDPFLPFLVFSAAFPVAFLAHRRLPAVSPPAAPPPPLAHVTAMFSELRTKGNLADFLGLLPFSTFALVVFAGLGFTTTPLYLEAEFGLGATQRGLVQALLSAGSTTGSLNTARLAERHGPGKVFSAGFGLVVLGFSVLAVAPSVPVAGLGLAAVGLGLGFSFPLLQDVVTSAVDARHRGAAVGTFVTAVRLGQSFGPVLGSAMAVNPGSRATYWIAGGCSLAVLLGWRRMRAAGRKMITRRLPPAHPSGT